MLNFPGQLRDLLIFGQVAMVNIVYQIAVEFFFSANPKKKSHSNLHSLGLQMYLKKCKNLVNHILPPLCGNTREGGVLGTTLARSGAPQVLLVQALPKAEAR